MATAHVFEWSRTYPVDARTAWETIIDDDLYAEVAPNLSAAEVLGEQGLGAVRRCTDPEGAQWTETCTAWEPGSRFSYEVHTETYPPGLRDLIERFAGTWAIEPAEAGTRVTLRFDAELTDLGLDVLVNQGAASPIFESILDGWEQKLGPSIESHASGASD